MNLLLPCAGRSSRFPTRVPKFLLAMQDNRLMIEHVAEPYVPHAERMLIGLLREHDQQFDIQAVLSRLFPKAEFCMFDQVTRGQAETVRIMLKELNVEGAFLVKDSDSMFLAREPYSESSNYVSVCSVRENDVVRLHNKSFAHFNEQGYIIGMTEKRVTSEYFSCGGYFFADVRAYCRAFDSLIEGPKVHGEIYVSHVIDALIQDGVPFKPMFCDHYVDLGTYENWVSYRSRFATYIFDLDGVVFKNSSRDFSPQWGETHALPGAAERICSLYDAGHKIVLITSRQEEYRAVTEAQLSREGIPYHHLIMGINTGCRYLINDYARSNPYPSAGAISTARDSADWIDKV